MHNFAHPSVCICSALKYPEALALLLGRSREGAKELIPRRAQICVSITSLVALPSLPPALVKHQHLSNLFLSTGLCWTC